MRESEIQSKIKKALENNGWFVTKLIQCSTNGIPDLLAIKKGRTVFIECKRPGGKASDLQKYRIKQLIDQDVEAFVAWSLDDIHYLL